MQERMGWVARMSLPDATRSDRVYPLLQNLDLENLAYATLQGTGETLNIEEMNEDELRRLVLINLARLSVKGEWDGLLSSGGGGLPFLNMATSLNTSQKTHFISAYPPFPKSALSVSTQAVSTACIFFPFVLPRNLTLASLTINISSGTTGDDLDLAIYNADTTTGVPTTKVSGTDVTFATGVSGGIVSNFSSSVDLTGGTVYWVGMVKNAGSITLNAHASTDGYPQAPLTNLTVYNRAQIVEDTASASLPTTFDPADYENGYGFVPLTGLVTT